jgi:hypothetical protein
MNSRREGKFAVGLDVPLLRHAGCCYSAFNASTLDLLLRKIFNEIVV